VASKVGGAAPIFAGDAVEIFGLTSDAGRQLNGCKGIATRNIPETGRFEVRIKEDKRVTVKKENLRLMTKMLARLPTNLASVLQTWRLLALRQLCIELVMLLKCLG